MSLEIQGLGHFEPQYTERSNLLFCFKATIQFHGQPVELIIYPNSKREAPSPEIQSALKHRFDSFITHLSEAISKMPSELRDICKAYNIDVSKVSDEEFITKLVWLNIKLNSDGSIECYTSNPLISQSFDIVVGFNERIDFEYVHFDG